MGKRFVGILTAVVAMGMSMPASIAIADDVAPGAFAGVFRTADIAAIRKIDGDTYMFFAGASHFRSSKHLRQITAAWADKSKCAVAETKNLKVIACSGRARVQKIAKQRFVMDPLMDEASLRFDGNKIRWKGQDLAEPQVFPFADPAFGVFAYSSLDRWARASGRILGTEIKGGRWSDFAYMSQGTYAFLSVSTPFGSYHVGRDGLLHYRFRFEIPR